MNSLKSFLRKIPLVRSLYHLLKEGISRLPFIGPGYISPYKIVLYPPFDNKLEVIDTYNKIQYFFPSSAAIKRISLSYGPKPFDDINNIPTPDYLIKTHSNINLFEWIRPSQRWLYIKRLIQADYILILNENKFRSKILSKFLGLKAQYVDRHKSVWDGWAWVTLGNRMSAQNSTHPNDAQDCFNKYVESLPEYTKAYVFGTGPSLDQAQHFNFSDGYRIVCNTIVKNQILLKHISPHFIVAADAIYHFGNNKHAYRFRYDLEKALDLTQAVFLTPDFFLYLLKYYHPKIYHRTIPIRTDLEGIFLDMKKKLAYSSLPNILNGILLPLGSSLADEVFLMGFDGRAPNDKLFWKNSGANSYEDLKPTIMADHPGFFNGIDFQEYARLQSDSAEKIMTLGEQMGKKYYCLNQTFIPALQKRMYPNAIQMV